MTIFWSHLSAFLCKLPATLPEQLSRSNAFWVKIRTMNLSFTKHTTLIVYSLPLMLVYLSLSACNMVSYSDAARNLYAQGSNTPSAFIHKTLFTKGSEHKNLLTVFIEGDGIPWKTETRISTEPTSPRPMLLDMMRQYMGDSIYLGRPCYFKIEDPKCHYRYWTSHRYSTEVLDSMTTVIEEALSTGTYTTLALVGHSGGGTIASLIACHFKLPTRLVTLGANLDVAAWTKHHKWTPLTSSLNPAEDTQPCANVSERHLHGQDDQVVPVHLNSRYYQAHQLSPFVVEQQGHTKWNKHWPEIYQAILSNQTR